MTSQQILKADLLDIVFEHRNKMYGAYELRKTYSRQLVKALALALGPVFLLVLFLPSTSGNQQVAAPSERVVVVEQVVLPKEKKPEPLQAAAPPKSEPVKQQKFTDNIVVKKEVTDPLPPQDLLENAAVSNTTVTEGTDASAFQPPVAPAASTGGTEVAEKEAPREIKPDRQPQFPGGMQAWLSFLGRHLQSPAELESGEKRTVLIRFHVAEDGSVTNFTLLQSAGEAFDKEVMRVLRKMPKWTPAMQAGNPVPVSFTQPVTFVGLEE